MSTSQEQVKNAVDIDVTGESKDEKPELEISEAQEKDKAAKKKEDLRSESDFESDDDFADDVAETPPRPHICRTLLQRYIAFGRSDRLEKLLFGDDEYCKTFRRSVLQDSQSVQRSLHEATHLGHAAVLGVLVRYFSGFYLELDELRTISIALLGDARNLGREEVTAVLLNFIQTKFPDVSTDLVTCVCTQQSQSDKALGQQMLQAAVISGNVASVQRHLTEEVSPLTVQPGQFPFLTIPHVSLGFFPSSTYTPLHLALSSGHVEITRVIFSSIKFLSALDEMDWQRKAVSIAMWRNDKELLSLLVDKPSVWKTPLPLCFLIATAKKAFSSNRPQLLGVLLRVVFQQDDKRKQTYVDLLHNMLMVSIKMKMRQANQVVLDEFSVSETPVECRDCNPGIGEDNYDGSTKCIMYSAICSRSLAILRNVLMANPRLAKGCGWTEDPVYEAAVTNQWPQGALVLLCAGGKKSLGDMPQPDYLTDFEETSLRLRNVCAIRNHLRGPRRQSTNALPVPNPTKKEVLFH